MNAAQKTGPAFSGPLLVSSANPQVYLKHMCALGAVFMSRDFLSNEALKSKGRAQGNETYIWYNLLWLFWCCLQYANKVLSCSFGAGRAGTLGGTFLVSWGGLGFVAAFPSTGLSCSSCVSVFWVTSATEFFFAFPLPSNSLSVMVSSVRAGVCLFFPEDEGGSISGSYSFSDSSSPSSSHSSSDGSVNPCVDK